MITLLTLLSDKLYFFGVEIINYSKVLELVIRFSLNLAVVMVLVRWLYYTTSKRKDYLFTYILISSIIFLLCFMLENVKIEMGFALGLFAIFGILRYRTSQMPIREMTYLFLVIGISVINALTNKKISVAEILFTNISVIVITYGFEKVWLLTHESVKEIIYEKIDMIKPEKRNELIEDLQQRTGIPKINKVEIGRIDFLRDTCRLNIYYYEKNFTINQADVEDTTPRDNDDD